MQHEINLSDGRRNRQFRPYIFGEETTFNTVMYNPFDSHNHGLYDSDHHVFERYDSHVANHFDLISRDRKQSLSIEPERIKPSSQWRTHGGVSFKSSSTNHSRMSDQRPYRLLSHL